MRDRPVSLTRGGRRSMRFGSLYTAPGRNFMQLNLLAGAFCAGLFSLAVSTTGLAQTAAAKGEPQVQPVCANCHEDKWHSIDLSQHGAKNDAAGTMCQNCHGDASAHLKDPSTKPANPFGKGKPA